MRKELCDALVGRAQDKDMVFLTGDLGYMALEPLRDTLGKRFINAGVAEQNMISVAAAMAKDGWQPWCYSIAPFCYARPFEQIRNDVCLHDLPVKLLANGGGYGYGVMGPTHHAVDDYAVMLALPFMKVYVPCFNEDVEPTIHAAAAPAHPAYVRLGRGELPDGEICPKYAPWRRVLIGDGPVVVVTGPIGGAVWGALRRLPADQRPDLWICSELPIVRGTLPDTLIERLAAAPGVVTIEEHIAHGGLNAMLAQELLTQGISVKSYTGLTAAGLALGTYGSQQYLRNHSGLSLEAIVNAVTTVSRHRL